jgi:FtsH-binding integral membrane protein
VHAFFPLGPISVTICGVLSALIFNAYIIYDIDNLIKHYTYDEFIWASTTLYLDVINLFLSLLQILHSIQYDN